MRTVPPLATVGCNVGIRPGPRNLGGIEKPDIGAGKFRRGVRVLQRFGKSRVEVRKRSVGAWSVIGGTTELESHRIGPMRRKVAKRGCPPYDATSRVGRRSNGVKEEIKYESEPLKKIKIRRLKAGRIHPVADVDHKKVQIRQRKQSCRV